MKRTILWAIALIFVAVAALRIGIPYRVGAWQETECLGKVRIPDSIDELALVRRGITTVIPPGKKEVLLPIGEYEYLYWKSNRTDRSNVKWQLRGHRFPRKARFNVTRTGTAIPKVGEPVIADLHIGSFARGEYTIGQSMTGSLGEYVDLYKKGSRIEPSMQITNAAGTYAETFKFKYG